MPSEVSLTASPRTSSGSRAAGRLRREGLVPAVVYGHGAEPASVSVVRRELRAALSGEAGANALLDLQVEGEAVLALVKDMQRDAVRNEVTHVDFIRVSRDEAVTVEGPIHFEAEALDMEAAAALEAEGAEGEAPAGEGAEAPDDAASGDEAPSDGEPGGSE